MPTPATVVANEESVSASEIDIPQCEPGIGSVITTPDSAQRLEGVRTEVISLWPDDRGHFLEVQRFGCGLAQFFPSASTQISACVTYPGVVKAFHYHQRQFDCWTIVKGMLQVALVDLRRDSRTFGRRNTLYVGEMRPWQVLIPPGVAHGYKVIGVEPAVLVYVTSRFYDSSDECRIAFNDERLNYDWTTQFK